MNENRAGKPSETMAGDGAEKEDFRRRAEELEAQLLEKTEQLQVANKELDDFAYSVSHDLRAPLRAIEGFSRILLEDFSSQLDIEARRFLEIVTTSAAKMQRLIDDLLSFSRLSRATLEPVKLNMNEIVSAAVQEASQKNFGRDVKVTVHPLPSASGDPVLVRKILEQLISNAFKFSSKQPEPAIEIGTLRDGKDVAFSVADNGVGFDMQYASKLFGVFQRLHAPEEFEGTGIGLAIVQRIVHRHGGRVWAEAKLNQGATFYFSLPEAPQTSSAPSAAP